MRKPLTIAVLVAVLMVAGVPAAAEDGVGAACPDGVTGAGFGAHVSHMAKAGGIGSDMNPGMHRGYSPMAH
jgi:hypothetical protein